MKNLYLLAFLLLAVFISSCSTSKEMEAQQLEMKKMHSELRDAKRDLERCAEKNNSMDDEANEYRKMADDMQTENHNLTQELQYTQEQLASMTRQMQEASDDYGVWFRVQIGAYGDRSIDQDLKTTDEMELENNNDLQKVSLGRFRNYDDAKRLQNQLKGMGLSDAWIVTYKDGKRVPIESVIKN